MQIDQTSLDGVLVITPVRHGDSRGFFCESWNRQRLLDSGIDVDFVQDNHSRSTRGVLRGLHYQHPSWQGKLVRALVGTIFDVAVDIRRESAHFGQWFGIELSAENKKQLYVPPGFAHGFCVLSDVAEMSYKCTALYEPKEDAGVLWNDPDIGIEWPIQDPLLSPKDEAAPRLQDLPPLAVPH